MQGIISWVFLPLETAVIGLWVDTSHISPQSWLFRRKKHPQCNLSCRKLINKSLWNNNPVEFVLEYSKHTTFNWLYSKRIFSLLCSLTWEAWNYGGKYNFKTYFLMKWGYYPTAWSHIHAYMTPQQIGWSMKQIETGTFFYNGFHGLR